VRRDEHRVIGTAAFSKVVIPAGRYPAEDYLSHTVWRRTSRFRVRHSIDISIDIAEFTAEPVEGYCLPLTAQHHTARTDLSDRETPNEIEKYQRSTMLMKFSARSVETAVALQQNVRPSQWQFAERASPCAEPWMRHALAR
jgi:hypothetical protein